MSEPNNQLARTLRSNRRSLTTARLAVFAALENREPQTMRNIVQTCSGRIDRASVYRTITLFEQLGIVQRLHIGWKYRLELSDTFSRHHHHLTCSRCSRTISLPEDQQLEERLQELAKRLVFEPQDHQIEIRGRCAACAKQAQLK